MASEIQFIFFDLGKVLVDFDHRICSENVAQITGLGGNVIHEIIFDSGLQSDYESGKITSTQFVERFNQAAGCEIGESRLLDAVSDIFVLNRSMVPLLTQLRAARFPIGILSNTCQAHWDFIMNRSPLLQKIFDPEKCVLSFKVGAVKPDPDIYEHARQVAGFVPEQIFFCDDLQRNIDGALAASFQAKVFTTPTRLARELIDAGVKVNL